MLLKNKLDNLKSCLKSDNVLANLEERYCYSKDASNIESNCKIPDLVVFVETIEDVQKVLRYANQHSIPVVARGAGTNMVGACVCAEGGIVLNFSKMNKILEINSVNMTAKVQPGVILGDLKDKLETIGLFYPPDPSNYRVSTIGGSIAQSSGGAMAFKYGTTKDYILSMKVVTAEGKLMTLGSETSKDSVGYHLGQLMIGSEGTLGIVVEATLKLIPLPESKRSIIGYFQDAGMAVSAINNVLTKNIFPASIDFMDNNSIRTVEQFMPCGLNTESKYLLLIDVDGMAKLMDEQLDNVKKALLESGATGVYSPMTPSEAEKLWQARRSSYAAATRLAPDVVSDDIIVPRDKLVKLLTACENIISKYMLKVCMVGHFGDGNLHPQFVLDLNNEKEFRNYQQAKSEIYDCVKELGGTISAEHGVGLEKKAYMENLLDENALNYMRMIKKTFDPNNILNPGKIFSL